MPFDWDPGNEDHVRKHDVEPREAEEALRDPRRLGVGAYNVQGERRWAVLAATESGRILFLVFTRREPMVRVVTARDARKREKRRYRTRGK